MSSSRGFGFKRRGSRGGNEESDAPASYVTPTLDSNANINNNSNNNNNNINNEGFVTAPPPVRGRNITSGISRMFRRPASKEPSERIRQQQQEQQQQQQQKPPLSSGPSEDTQDDETAATSVKYGGGVPSTKSSDADASKNSAAIPRSNSRLFYSSTLDDDSDSDDSYTSRVSRRSNHSSHRSNTSDDDGGDGGGEYVSHTDETGSENPQNPKMIRYRGFSTSLQNLFLDEQLVCAAVGCFGLFLSQRTEYLINIRNERRGLKPGKKNGVDGNKQPSRILWIVLALTFFLISLTYMTFGFGNSNAANSYSDEYVQGYDYDFDGDDANNNYNNNNNGNDDGNNNNNDDHNNYNNDDDWQYNKNYANDDYNQNAYFYADDYYGNNTGNNRRVNDASSTTLSPSSNQKYHPIQGVFKIRDYQEHLWEPACDFIKDEWYRKDESANPTTNRKLPKGLKVRHLDENEWYDDYASGGYDNDFNANQDKDIGGSIRGFLCLMFFIFLGVFGRRRRMVSRYSIVRARAHEDHLYYASLEVDTEKKVAYKYVRENQYEGACSHTLCGCYPVDPPEVAAAKGVVENDSAIKKRTKGDCMTRLFSCFMGTCCGVLCKCWFQCMSICALAQEAREVRLLLPPRLQRIDFITHQPFSEYQKDVNDLRRGWLGKRRPKGGIMPHIYALSRLSRYIIIFFVAGVLAIITTLLLNPKASFSVADAIVLLATFIQSFIVLYVVHWIFHKSDLSFDAVVKFFAAGFLIAVPSSFFFEGLLVNIILAFAYTLYSIIELIKGEVFVTWVINNYRLLWILAELFNAYVVAAVTEEICKYYTFRSVEHPDLIFLTGLDRKSHEEFANHGGDANYEFGSHQVSNFNQRVNSFASESDYSVSKRNRSFHKNEERTSTKEEFFEDDTDIRTYRQRAAAITTGMISVAVGLACAENFLYVFVLGGTGSNPNDDNQNNGVLEEWIVLFFRSIFPVHALAAAMQSINMIRKFVECTTDNSNHNIGIGRIIIPAVIVHGTFDAILLGINVYIETAWDLYLEANAGNVGDGQPYNPVIVNLIAWLSIVVVMCAGIAWYFNEHRKQVVRLILMEQADKAREGGGDAYENPTLPSGRKTSEIEIV